MVSLQLALAPMMVFAIGIEHRRAGISTASAELLLERMQAKIEGLCDERDRLKKEEGGPTKGRVLGGRSWRCANN